MKKIYIALFAVFLALVALMVIYRINNPPDNAPTADYTRVKAELLLHNYRQDEAQTGDGQSLPDHSKIYGVMIEQTVEKADGGSAAGFVFFDCFGVCTAMNSDNSGYARFSDEAFAELSESVFAEANGIYDDTFSRAKKSNYDVPHTGDVRVYVRAGDGVFYKTFKAEETPQKLAAAYGIAREAAAQTEDQSE